MPNRPPLPSRYHLSSSFDRLVKGSNPPTPFQDPSCELLLRQEMDSLLCLGAVELVHSSHGLGFLLKIFPGAKEGQRSEADLGSKTV